MRGLGAWRDGLLAALLQEVTAVADGKDPLVTRRLQRGPYDELIAACRSSCLTVLI